MIRIDNLRKSFGKFQVLKGMTLDIPAGQATGIVGPNGAGKTTLIKTILGLVKPDSGTIHINNVKLNGNCLYRRDIGYMPQIARYPENMKVYELFDFIKSLRDQEAVFEKELIAIFSLQSELNKPLRNLSGGNRQKVGATLSMMFNPHFLFFDEPTAGLDPRSSHLFKKRVETEKANGKSVFITSHIMSELEQLVDHLLFILEGEVRYYGPVKEILEITGEDRLEAAISGLMDSDLPTAEKEPGSDSERTLRIHRTVSAL
jgi:Cu-processing system ATP-binding protein